MGTFKNPDVWKKNLAYQIGDFVLYDGIVYMAIKPVPAGTDMSTDYWIAFEEGAIVPTGEISITENGEVNVAQYATANVNVEGGGGGATRTLQLLCVEIANGVTVGPTTAGLTAPTVSHFDWETYQGTPVDIGEKSIVTVDEVTGVWKYEFDVAVGELYIIGGEDVWILMGFYDNINSDAQNPTVFNDVFTAEADVFTPTNYSTTVIVSYDDIVL